MLSSELVRIAFVSGNREHLPDAVTPLGLLYVMASTPDRHEKILIDLCFEPQPAEALGRALAEARPDLVALGMRNIQNNDYSGLSDNLEYYAELIRTSRAACGAPIVLGGSGFSVMPADLMRRLAPDYGISGEGEEAFPRLVEALERGGRGLDEIGALHRLSPHGVVSSPRAAGFLDMNTLPVPDRKLVDRRYHAEYGIDSIQTKRGCPLLCAYCTYPTIEGRVGRVRRPAAVVDEMFQALADQPSIRHFFIVDSVFNLPTVHAKNVCRELIARDWRVPWTCYANPLGFDLEFAELARAAGCAGMEIGSDSGSERVLEELKKGFTLEHVRRLHRHCVAAGLPDCHTFILGTQGETLDDVRRTLDFIAELDPFGAVLMIWVDDYEALDPELRARRMVLRREIEALLLERKDQYPHWSIPALGIRFGERLFTSLRRLGRHGPLWQHAREPLRPVVRGVAREAAAGTLATDC
jgi:radical SAM superfamily enzyme YgiQ (UPF0313 family)